MGFHRKGNVCSLLPLGISIPHLSLSLFFSYAFISPGQELPEMPRPTHGCPGHPFLPPHRSLGQAFENIDPNDRLHEKRPYKWPRPSNIVPTEPLHATLTCAVHIPYWDESRPLTKRELARIQSFPDSHVFGDSQVSRQSRYLSPRVFYVS